MFKGIWPKLRRLSLVRQIALSRGFVGISPGFLASLFSSVSNSFGIPVTHMFCLVFWLCRGCWVVPRDFVRGDFSPMPFNIDASFLVSSVFFCEFFTASFTYVKNHEVFMDSKLLRRHLRINLQFMQYYWGCSRKISNFLIFLAISLCFVSPMFYFSPLIWLCRFLKALFF